MNEKIDRAVMQLTTFEKLSKVTALDLITLAQRYEIALKRIADQPEPLPRQIAEQALGDDE